MEITITDQHFATEDEAFAEIEARGWHGITLDFDVDEEDFHWHDFQTVAFILSGTLRAEDESGQWYTAGAGARVEAPARFVHREVDSRHRTVIGIDIPLDELTLPINRPVSELSS